MRLFTHQRQALLFAAVLAVIGSQTSWAQTSDTLKWNCGYGKDSVKAMLIGNTLTISGTGKMQEYGILINPVPPWYDHRSIIYSVVIDSGVTLIGRNSFAAHNAMTSIIIPESVTEIGMEAFNGCKSLTSITIPNSVKTIRMAAFAYCTGLTEVTIPEGVTEIVHTVFSGCKGLKTIKIPKSVTTIADMAFYNGCTSLTSIIYLNPIPPRISEITFPMTNNICLYVPQDYIAAYASANYWKNFSCIKDTGERDVFGEGRD